MCAISINVTVSINKLVPVFKNCVLSHNILHPNVNLSTGDFLAGQRHGRGRHIFANGNEYVGEYLGGKMEGNGE